MRIEVRGRNVEVTDELREHVVKRFRRVGKQVSELATLDVELYEERNPSIADSQVAEATLRLKGVTLRAKEARPEMAPHDPRAGRGHPPPGQEAPRAAPQAHPDAPRRRPPAGPNRGLRARLTASAGPATLGPCLRGTWSRARCASGRGANSRPTRSAPRRSTASSPRWRLLEDSELREEADKLRERARDGESLDDLLPEAFALTREAARRTLGQRHYDVQLIGGMVLNDGAIAEMRTGEGKTLTATLAVFLNTLAGDSVHLVTVNDYLARRDAEWMKPIYDALGVSVAAIQEGDDHEARQRKYACDVVYGTNSEFGFDYLRDNMAAALEHCVQRGHHFAIVDEVDNILIDEARTPLIISGAPEQAAQTYYTVRPPRQADGRRPGQREAQIPGRVEGHLRRRLRLRVRREAQDGLADRARRQAGRGVHRRRQPLPRRARQPGQPPGPVAEGRVALQTRTRTTPWSTAR